MLGWASQLLSDTRTWVIALGLALLALLASVPLARRMRWPRWATAGMLLGAALVATLTLSPAPGHPIDGPTVAAVGDCLRTLADPPAWWHALVSTDTRGERVGNVLMFVPGCLFAVLATRRPLLVAAIGAASPLLIEIGQAVLAAGRDCAADDLLNNATGAVLGAAAGAAVVGLRRLVGPRPLQDHVDRPQQDHQIERE